METRLTAEAYARFLALQGYRVRRTPSAYWFDANRWFLLSAPHHREYVLQGDELRGLFRSWGCLGVRYAAPVEAGLGKLSYQIVLDDPHYGLAQLSSNVRSKVRRGLKRCEVARAELSVLEQEGWPLHVETLRRQKRGEAWTSDRWTRFWHAAQQTPGVEGWGAWVDGRLAAFLVTVMFEDAVEFFLSRSTTGERGAYPNNALIFTVAEEMLVRRQMPKITFGLESLEPVKPLDEFKFGMGFQPRPIRQVVVFHPLLRLLLARAAAREAIQWWVGRRAQRNVFWRKAAGLLRFAQEASWDVNGRGS